MYSAERQKDPKLRFLYRGTFGETVDAAVRPTVVIYDVSSLTFHTLGHVPANMSLGQSIRPEFCPKYSFLSKLHNE
jgi:hypothetical protein